MHIKSTSTNHHYILVLAVSFLVVIAAFILNDLGLESQSALDSKTTDSSIIVVNGKSISRNNQAKEGTSKLNNKSTTLIWSSDISPMDFLDELQKNELISAHGIADWRRSWIGLCMAVRQLELDAITSPEAKLALSLRTYCEDFLPRDFNLSDVVDQLALYSEFMELSRIAASNASILDMVDSRLAENVSNHRLQIVDFLTSSLDPHEIQIAVTELIRGSWLNLEPDIERFLLESPEDLGRISSDVAISWLCHRLGGCKKADHPLVLKRCFEGGGRCFDPTDIDDAIFQSITAFNYGIYLLINEEITAFLLRNRR